MDPVKEEVEETIETEEELNDGILGAIDTELETVSEEPAPEPAPDPESEEPEHEPAETDDLPTSEESDEPVPEPEGKPDDDDAEVQVPAADADPEAAKPDDDKPAEEKPKAEGKPSDEFETLEEGTPEKTKERFEALKGRFDEVTGERDNAIQERDQILEDANIWKTAITNTQTTPEQFGNVLEYLAKVNSKKPEDLEAAYAMMKEGMANLGKQLGKKVSGEYDPLTDHPDLQEKVRTGVLDEDIAYEMAESRAKNKLSETNYQRTETETNQKTAISSAMADVKALSATLKANDPDFDAKLPFMEPIIVSAVKSGAPPEKWLTMIEDAYAKMPTPAVAAGAPPPKPVVPDPIRPGGTPAAANLESEPGSVLEAMNQSLERGW